MVRWYPALLPPPPPPQIASISTASQGYTVYNSVPYGNLFDVLPYLSRRAAENRAVLEGTRRERTLLTRELRARAFGFWPNPAGTPSTSCMNLPLNLTDYWSFLSNRGKVMFTRSSFFSPWNDLYVLNYQFYHFQIDFLELVLDHFLLLVSLTGNSIVGVEIETSAWPLGMAKVMWTKKYWNA